MKIDEKDWLFWSKKCWHNLADSGIFQLWHGELTIQWLRSTKWQLSGIFRSTVVRPWRDSIGSIPSCSETGLPECQWQLVVMSWEGLPCGTGMPWGFERLAGQDDVQSAAAGKTDHCLVWEFGNSKVQCFSGKKLWKLLYSYRKPWNESTTSRHEQANFLQHAGMETILYKNSLEQFSKFLSKMFARPFSEKPRTDVMPWTHRINMVRYKII